MNICNHQNTLNLFELPPEDLVHIASYLTLKDVKQLHATCYDLQPVTQLFINADTQETLEKNISYKPELYSYLEIAKALPKNSEERIQISRDAICSLFFAHETLASDQYRIELNRKKNNSINWSLHGHLEYKLATQIVKTIKSTSNIECHSAFYAPTNMFIACMDVLENNEISPKTVEINFNQKSKTKIPLDKKILNLILKTLKNNKSIYTLILSADDWNPLDLDNILKEVKANDRISKVTIFDNDWILKRWCNEIELDTVIRNRLGIKVAHHNGPSWTWYK